MVGSRTRVKGWWGSGVVGVVGYRSGRSLGVVEV